MKFVVLAFAMSLPASVACACEATKAEYDALEMGLSYADTVRIIGCDGEEMSRSDIAGIVTVMIMWPGRSMASNMTAMFQNDELISKAQLGLQ